MKKTWKMSQLVRFCLIMLIAIFVGVVIYLNVFVLEQIRKQEAAKEEDMLTNMVNVWDSLIENNTIFIENFVANNDATVKLAMAKTHEDEVYALQEIKSTLTEYSYLNNGMDEFFFYSEKIGKDGYLTNNRSIRISDMGTAKERINKIIEVFHKADKMRTWLLLQIEGRNYLAYLSEKNGNYVGCWCQVDKFLQMAAETDLDTSHVFAVDEQGISRTDSYLEGMQIDLENNRYEDQETGEKYWQISKKSNLVAIWFVEHVVMTEAEHAIIQSRNIMVIACIILAMILILFSGFLEYFLYQPIRRLIEKMMQIAEGQFENKIEDTSHLREIQVLNETFNQMVDEIKNLKIEIYEDEIREQKIRLQYLQMQIRPHFLVNALNSVRTMIDMKREDSAVEMCCYLADYFRALSRNNIDMVIISEELKQVETYVNIQKMRRPGKIFFECSIDEDCNFYLIPPILLLTFVENSLKYGIDDMKNENHIQIVVTKEESILLIMISDNGPGFSDEVLTCIKEKRNIIQNDRECLGIRNVMARLQLFYPDKVQVDIYNDDGAVVEIHISV